MCLASRLSLEAQMEELTWPQSLFITAVLITAATIIVGGAW